MGGSRASRGVSLTNLRAAFWFLLHRSSLRFGAALLIPVAMRLLLPLLRSGWPVAGWLGLLVSITALLAWRRRPLAWVTAYFLAADVWVLLWLAVGDGATSPHIDYPVVLDRILGLGELPTERLQHWFFHEGVVGPQDIAFVVVYGTFFFAHQVTLWALWLLRPQMVGRYAIAFLSMSYLALLVFFLVPTAPPWMASELGMAPEITRVAHEVLHAAIGSAFDEGYAAASVNEVAAMPSVHLGATTVVAVAWMRANPRLRGMGIGYCVAMGLALVYLGEHYLVDVLAGAALGLASWRIADLAYARIPWLGRGTDEPAPDVAIEETARAA